MRWYVTVLRKYAVFNGRARRKEYWYFSLFNFLIAVVFLIFCGFATMAGDKVGVALIAILFELYDLGTILPGVTVGVRRLHDIGRSGWWLFLAFLPLIGAIVLLIWFARDSDPRTNMYGPNPKTGFDGPAPALPVVSD